MNVHFQELEEEKPQVQNKLLVSFVSLKLINISANLIDRAQNFRKQFLLSYFHNGFFSHYTSK